MLFLIAARDCLNDESIKLYIDSKYLKNNNVKGDTEYKIKLKQVESDWEAYKNLVLMTPLSERDKVSRVYKNYSFFKSVLTKKSDEEIKNLIENGLANFNIVTI